MLKKFFCFLFSFTILAPCVADTSVVSDAEKVFAATKTVCYGLSDEISKLSGVSKVNTAVTVGGTVAAGGALVAGIKKSQEEERIDELVAQICENGGCTAAGVDAMSDEYFYNNVIIPMSEIAELQEKLDKSKSMGNWRTGLMAGTIGTNVASAIISGINSNQSDLIQHVQACNEAIKSVRDMSGQLRAAGINPREYPIAKKIDSVKTWCNSIDVADIEKIENKMKVVMGTSIAGGVVGVVGTSTSAAANSSKYTDANKRLSLSEEDVKKKDTLNTVSNVMAGANVATGLVETGFNISMITLTKKLIDQAKRCEEVLK